MSKTQTTKFLPENVEEGQTFIIKNDTDEPMKIVLPSRQVVILPPEVSLEEFAEDQP